MSLVPGRPEEWDMLLAMTDECGFAAEGDVIASGQRTLTAYELEALAENKIDKVDHMSSARCTC
jgi:hypothetical protein